MNPNVSQIGAYIKARSADIKPAANAAGTVTSTSIDRLNPVYNSAVLVVQAGASTGGPTSFTLDAKVQHSDDNAAWSDYTPPPLSGVAQTAAITTITAASTNARKAVDLAGAKRYVRTSMTTAFVGGASPTQYQSALLVLGGAQTKPTVD